MGKHTEEKYRELVFEPDVEFTEEEMGHIEEQMVDLVKEKLGEEYGVVDWKLEIKGIVFAEKEEKED